MVLQENKTDSVPGVVETIVYLKHLAEKPLAVVVGRGHPFIKGGAPAHRENSRC